MHARLIDTILQAKLHVIATMRSKIQYELVEDEKGRKTPRQMGMEMIQHDDTSYEFDIMGELDKDNLMVITKTRCKALTGKAFHKPGADLGHIIHGWLSHGAPIEVVEDIGPALATGQAVVIPKVEAQHPTDDQLASLKELAASAMAPQASDLDDRRCGELGLTPGTKPLKKDGRMLSQESYERLWTHYSTLLKEAVEDAAFLTRDDDVPHVESPLEPTDATQTNPPLDQTPNLHRMEIVALSRHERASMPQLRR